jgi:undecaprenyl diphosphate synthase
MNATAPGMFKNDNAVPFAALEEVCKYSLWGGDAYAYAMLSSGFIDVQVDALMKLLELFLREKTPEMLEQNIRLQAIGRLHDLPQSCQAQLHRSIESTSQNTGLTLILALSYGGREEIIDGVKSLIESVERGHLDKGMIDVDVFSKHLYTRYYPYPDLLIRTSGEMRLSNFLLWQLSYTEFYITDKFWPDFGKDELNEAVRAYAKRHRRFGAV